MSNYKDTPPEDQSDGYNRYQTKSRFQMMKETQTKILIGVLICCLAGHRVISEGYDPEPTVNHA